MKKEKLSAKEVLHDIVAELHESCNGGVYTRMQIVDNVIESAEAWHDLVLDIDFSLNDIEDAMNFYEWNFSN